MNRPLRTVRVFADLSYFEKPQMMGLLHYQPAARGGIFSFEYGPAWLKQAEALAFDPDLSLVEGPQYPAAEHGSFGIFLGRVLMQRRENVRARKSNEKPAALNEWDYLLGVHDETRLGAESPYTTFLARRFDRTETERRLAFISAMTLTQRTDGEPGASYLELVELLQSRGADTHGDCVELFRRVVFNILIRNTDDHLRNHGFFISQDGISLAPAYDMNPSMERNELTLAINEVEATCDISIAMDASSDYGISKDEADGVIQEVKGAVSSWRAEAASLRIPKAEQEFMAAAFD